MGSVTMESVTWENESVDERSCNNSEEKWTEK